MGSQLDAQPNGIALQALYVIQSYTNFIRVSVKCSFRIGSQLSYLTPEQDHQSEKHFSTCACKFTAPLDPLERIDQRDHLACADGKNASNSDVADDGVSGVTDAYK